MNSDGEMALSEKVLAPFREKYIEAKNISVYWKGLTYSEKQIVHDSNKDRN